MNRLRNGLLIVGLTLISNFSQALDCPISVTPGKNLGPIEIGMKREDLSRLGLKIDIKSEDPDYLTYGEKTRTQGLVGPFWVTLEDEKVVTIRSTTKILPDCLKIGDETLTLKKRPDAEKQIQARYKSCAKATAGNGLTCHEGLSIYWNAKDSDILVGAM